MKVSAAEMNDWMMDLDVNGDYISFKLAGGVEEKHSEH